ncbi:MAG: T9SS type A sorting domain-containing protein [Bacteroidota bacterium]
MVYPNPSQDGKFTVKMPEAGRVQVTNLLGKEVFSKVFLAGEHQINLSDQRKGIYSFRIAAGKTMKLIVN